VIINIEDAVIRHRSLSARIANDYFLPGGDRDDVEQEAFIGLWEAARCYNGEIPFTAFASIVIHRRLNDALRRARRGKHGPLNTALRSIPLEEDSERIDIGEAIPAWNTDADEILERRDEIRAMVGRLGSLTPLERRVLAGFLDGREYSEMGPTKSVDNALQRARKKLAA